MQQIPRTDTDNKHSSQYPAAEHCMQNFITATGEKATEAKSTISLRTVSGLNAIPTGYCIHELATKIHQAEKVAPNPVSQVDAR